MLAGKFVSSAAKVEAHHMEGGQQTSWDRSRSPEG